MSGDDHTTDERELLVGHIAVLDVRTTALADAIRRRDWAEVEWQHDRVRRALDKLLRAEGLI